MSETSVYAGKLWADGAESEVGHLQSLQILFDSTGVEIFVNGGEAVMSARYYPNGQRALQISGVCDVRMIEFREPLMLL